MRKFGNKSMVLGITGLLFIIMSAVLIIIGKNINDNFYAQIEYYYAYGVKDSSGGTVMTFGIALAVIGAILIFISLYFNFKSGRMFTKTLHNQDYDEVDDMISQLAGNKTIFDVFHSEDRSKVFSFYRNKTCILKEGDTVYRGKMEALEWAAGHPTLWRITIDRDSEDESCEISKVDGNILVKGDRGEEIFYRN